MEPVNTTIASNETEFRALLDGRLAAIQAKDIDRLMSFYSSGIVYYDVVPTVQFVGSDEVRRNFTRWFDEYDGSIGLETHNLNIEVGVDLAFAHMLHADSGARKNGVDGAIWVKSTVCCRRSGDKWSIVHEHISLPGNWLAQFEKGY